MIKREKKRKREMRNLSILKKPYDSTKLVYAYEINVNLIKTKGIN